MTVRVELVGATGAVLLLTLDRPSRRNAVDHPTLLELLAIQASDDTGRRGTASGRDHRHPAGVQRRCRSHRRRARSVHRRPVVGAARLRRSRRPRRRRRSTGRHSVPGAQLAVAADLRVATPAQRDRGAGRQARPRGRPLDGAPFRRRVLASRRHGRCSSAPRRTPAERLHDLGAVHRLGDLDDALAWADQLASLAPLTIAGHKLALEHRSDDPPIVELGRDGAGDGVGQHRRRRGTNGVPREAPATFSRAESASVRRRHVATSHRTIGPDRRRAILTSSCRISSGGCAAASSRPADRATSPRHRAPSDASSRRTGGLR